jgi:hypothetical protein
MTVRLSRAAKRAAHVAAACYLTSLSANALPSVPRYTTGWEGMRARDESGLVERRGGPLLNARIRADALAPAKPSRDCTDCVRIRGGAAQTSHSVDVPIAAVKPVPGSMSMTELLSGGVVAAAAMMLGSSALFLLLIALFVIRAFNPAAAVSAAAYLQTAFRLHDEWKALVLCGPLALLPLSLTKVAAPTVALLLVFFAGMTIVTLGAMGIVRDVVCPLLTGFRFSHSEDGHEDVLKDAAGRELYIRRPDPQPPATTQKAPALLALTGVAVCALALSQHELLILCSAILATLFLKLCPSPSSALECPAAALAAYGCARMLAICKDADATALLRHLSVWSAAEEEGRGGGGGGGGLGAQLGRVLANQAGAVLVALVLKLWAGTRNTHDRNPKPSTLNPQPSTLNPQPSTLDPQPSTLNPKL